MGVKGRPSVPTRPSRALSFPLTDSRSRAPPRAACGGARAHLADGHARRDPVAVEEDVRDDPVDGVREVRLIDEVPDRPLLRAGGDAPTRARTNPGARDGWQTCRPRGVPACSR
jgi:hypothetical protein